MEWMVDLTFYMEMRLAYVVQAVIIAMSYSVVQMAVGIMEISY